MIIQHNLFAINSQRQFKISENKKIKSAEKLSSGYRINRSADDAAGLQISEKMRGQIKGLEQAEKNIMDGISLIQTAEGAIGEIQNIVHRCRELSVQAANDTNVENDRSAIQKEVNELLEEIDFITETTEFNRRKVLQGERIEQTTEPVIVGGLPAWVDITKDSYMSSEYINTQNYTDPLTGQIGSASIHHESAFVDFSDLTSKNLKQLVDTGFYFTCCTCDRHYSIRFQGGTNNFVKVSGEHYVYNIGIDGIKNGEELIDRILIGTADETGELGNPMNHYTKLVKDTTNLNKLIIYDDRANHDISALKPSGSQWTDWENPYGGVTADPTRGKFGKGVAVSSGSSIYGDPIVLQVGANTNQLLEVYLPNTFTSTMNIKKGSISVMNSQSAGQAIKRFDTALNQYSEERSRMGAYQNRLEHAMANVVNIAENLQSAESKIRDADMAEEVMIYSKYNIIMQAAQSMLAQANQIPQNILSLLPQ